MANGGRPASPCCDAREVDARWALVAIATRDGVAGVGGDLPSWIAVEHGDAAPSSVVAPHAVREVAEIGPRLIVTVSRVDRIRGSGRDDAHEPEAHRPGPRPMLGRAAAPARRLGTRRRTRGANGGRRSAVPQHEGRRGSPARRPRPPPAQCFRLQALAPPASAAPWPCTRWPPLLRGAGDGRGGLPVVRARHLDGPVSIELLGQLHQVALGGGCFALVGAPAEQSHLPPLGEGPRDADRPLGGAVERDWDQQDGWSTSRVVPPSQVE